MLGGIIAIHYVWYQIQQNEDFVPPNERRIPAHMKPFVSGEKKEKKEETQSEK